MNNKPLLFFTFANSPERYLPYLKTEERGILDQFTTLKHIQGILDFEHREQVTSKDFFEIFRQIREKITMLHYSGHADSVSMGFDDGDYSIDRFSTLISELPNLQLVFLNGCATAGMVDLLLEKGVKAVIATSEKIGDNKACDFSLNFYKAITVKGKKLGIAFKEAISTLEKIAIKEDDFFVPRGVCLRDEYMNKVVIPWAIYYQDEAVLDWILVPKEILPEINGAVKEKIISKKKNIEEVKQTMFKFEEDIEISELALNAPSCNDSKAKKIQIRIEEQKEEINLSKQKLEKLYADLRHFCQSQVKLEEEEQLKNAFFRLNYESQITYFEEQFKNIGAYLIQGSPDCGQDILRKRLLSLGQFKPIYKDELHYEIHIDFSAQTSATISIETIWSYIKDVLEEIDALEPEGIVKEIFGKYFKKKSLVFVFNNIDCSMVSFNQKIIKEFWFVFLKYFLPLVKKEKVDSKLLLVIVDKNCQLKLLDGKSISDKEEVLRLALDETGDEQKAITHIMPIITPLESKILSQWKFHQELSNHLITKEVLEDVLKKNNGYIMPTIKGICQALKMDDLYYKHFRDYEYKLPTL